MALVDLSLSGAGISGGAWLQSFLAVVRNKSRSEDSIPGLVALCLTSSPGRRPRLVAYRWGRFRLASLVFEW